MKPIKKNKHGGKRTGAGRKPGTAPHQCSMCPILLKQLEDARHREARLMRQMESKDEQIGTVIQHKFETFHFAGERPKSELGSTLPVESLMDVQAFDDEAFVREAEKIMEQKPQ